MTNRLRNIIANEWFIALVVGFICFCVYLTTMCRTVSFIDAGELATVASVLGIAHPTGYPLFSILGHCVLWIPLGNEEVLKLNIFSSMVVAVAVGVFLQVLLAGVRLADPKKRKGRDQSGGEKPELLLAAAIASLVLGFSTTVWAQSVAVEVYGLHILLILVTILLFLRGIHEDAEDSQSVPPRLIAALFFLGLSFSNHLTTILVVPALVYLYAKWYGVNRQAARRAVKLLPFFFLGLSPYLYLPIRARVHPPLNWGYPAELERLLWHVSGKQYRSWMFSSFDSAERQLNYFINHFPSEYSWLVIPIMLLGVWKAYRSSKIFFWFLVIAFVSCVFYSINYEVHDIDSYFLLAYIVAGVFGFFGITAILEIVAEGWSKPALSAVSVLLLALPVVQVTRNHEEVSEADNYLAADYTHNIFVNAEPNAVILTYQWDYFVAPSLYYQIVRKERPELIVIDKELLRRSWYFINLKNRYPWLIERSQATVDAFLAELYKFEHDLPYDPRVIEARYVEMINDFIDRSYGDRPVYVGPEIEAEFGQQYSRIPNGLLFRLAREADNAIPRAVQIGYRSASIDTRLTQAMRGLYSKMLTATAAHLLKKNRRSDAIFCLEKVLVIDPTYEPARALRKGLTSEGSQEKP